MPHDATASLTIRPERLDDPAEVAAIRAVVAAAFGGEREADLVDAIRRTPEYRPESSLVALRDGEVVGHVMISTAYLVDEASGERRHEVASLSPLAVDPQAQRQGVGTALIEAAVASAEEAGEPFVVLEGSPRFYGERGFEASAPLGVVFDLPEWAPPEAAQLRRLSAYDPSVRGRLVYSSAFDGLD